MAKTIQCPKCSKPIFHAAKTCHHCGAVVDQNTMPNVTATAEMFGSKKKISMYLLFFVVCLVAWYFWQQGGGFSQADIDRTKATISSEFGKRDGVQVVDVQMVKESANRLTGFVKLKINVLGESMEVTKNCSATWGEGGQYIWKCD
jgi:hypothetical protein